MIQMIDMLLPDGSATQVQDIDLQKALLNGYAYPTGGTTPYVMKDPLVHPPEVFGRFKNALTTTDRDAMIASGWVQASPALTGAQTGAGAAREA